MAIENELIRAGLDRLNEGFGIFDAGFELVYCNRLFGKLRDYPEALCQPGTPLPSMLRFNAERGDLGPGVVDDLVAARLAEVSDEDHEMEREMANGRILNIRYQHLDDGGLTVTFQDKTEERQAQQALAESEARYALVSRAAQEVIYEWHVQTNRFFASPRIHDLVDIAISETGIRDWDWIDWIHPDDAEHYRSRLRDHVSGDVSSWDCEYRVRGKDGGYRWISDYGTSIRGETGEAIRMVAAVRDITDLKAAEQALASKEEELRLTLDSLPGSLIYTDEDLNIVFCNDGYRDVFPGQRDMLQPGRNYVDMLTHLASIGAYGEGTVESLVAERIEGIKNPTDRIHETHSPDGRIFRVRRKSVAGGGTVTVATDITDSRHAEEKLARTQAQLRLALENIPGGIELVDKDMNYVFFNDQYWQMHDYPEGLLKVGGPASDEVVFQAERGDYGAGDVATLMAGAQEPFTAGERNSYERTLPNGRTINFNVAPTPDGGYVTIATDISERKKAEEELAAKETQLRLALESMPGGIVLCDTELNYVLANARYGELCGIPQRLLANRGSTREVMRFQAERGDFGPGDVETLTNDLFDLYRSSEPVSYERSFVGGDRTVQIDLAPTPDGGYVSTVIDITERKAAEQALQERETQLTAAFQEFDAVLSHIEYGVLFMDSNLKARIINRAFGRIWGISQEFIDTAPGMRELIEYNKDTGLYDIAAEAWEAWIEARVETVRQGNFGPVDLPRADGTIIQYQCIALPDGGRMLTYFDITELKQREMELIAARDDAERTLRELELAQERLVQSEKMASLGQLTAGIAHELKNPLNFVNNFARLSDEMLEELAEILEGPVSALDEEMREEIGDLMETTRGNLAKINQHGRRADAIIKNMLLHSRESSGEAQSVGLNGLAEEALNLAYHGARAENSDFNVDIERAFSEAGGEIDCFPQDLMRVFLNLISNAMYAANSRKASGERPGQAPIISVRTGDADGYAVVEVRDNGGGIPDDIRQQIFTPFFTTKPAGEGTGLGLSISYDIVVKQHGGAMTVESEPGEFTVFKVTLPRRMAAVAD